MKILEQARKAVFGETWALPIGVAVLVGGAEILRHLAGESWSDIGGPLLVGGAVALFVLLLRRSRPA
jgi:hypothetical protein